eukprot:gene10497-1909_t
MGNRSSQTTSASWRPLHPGLTGPLGTDESVLCTLSFCGPGACDAVALLSKADLLYQLWRVLGGQAQYTAGPGVGQLVCKAPPGLLEATIRELGPLAAVCPPSRMDERDMEALVRLCPRVTKLALFKCTDITGRGLLGLDARGSEVLELDVSGCRNLTTRRIIRIARACPHLRKLNLSSCDGIRGAGVMSVGQSCPQLQTLNLHGVHNITDAAVVSLGQSCTQLYSLDLSWNTMITDAAVALFLNDCHNISDASVVFLGQSCPQLATLDVSRCRNITDAGASASN